MSASFFSLRKLAGPSLLLLALLAMYGNGVFRLASQQWSLADEGHGPILAVMALWAFWNERAAIAENAAPDKPVAGALLLAFSLLSFFIGRVLDIQLLELGSLPITVSALILLFHGSEGLRVAMYPLLFLVFVLPLPNNLIDAVTTSLKHTVSGVAEQILYRTGYPVARSGVMLTVGQYQLLVADACSGLRSILSLLGVGLFFMYMSRPMGRLRGLLVLAALVPIAFVANVLRVMVLILVTYHFGDAAGQGFVHEAAGMFLFVSAVCMVAGLDFLLRRILKR